MGKLKVRKNHLVTTKAGYRIFLLVLFCLLLISFLVSFCFGRYTQLSPIEVFKMIFNKIFPNAFKQTWESTAEIVVFHYRMPRIIAAILVGAALPMAGAAYQAIFSNPMASPDTLGVSNGASVGAVIAILLGFVSFMVELFAFAIGCLAVIFVYFVSLAISKGKNLTVYLILVGMVVGSLLSSVLSILKYCCDPTEQLPAITYWLMGSFASVTMRDLLFYVIFFIVGAVPLLCLRWRMNILSLNDFEAKSLGENVNLLRTIAILCATLLTASSIAITGGIGWVGLIIPHIARILVGQDFKRVLPASALLGSIFLVLMDDLSRSVMVNEIPIGILTALVGAPIFFVVLVKHRKAMLSEN